MDQLKKKTRNGRGVGVGWGPPSSMEEENFCGVDCARSSPDREGERRLANLLGDVDSWTMPLNSGSH